MKSILFLMTAFTFLFSNLAHAENLSESAINQHLQNENKLLKAYAGKKNPAKVKQYLEKHLTSNFSYQDTVNTSLGQFGGSTENISYNRRDYIASIYKSMDALKGVNSVIKINNVNKLSDDKARVSYSTIAKMDAENKELYNKSSAGFGIDTSSNCVADMLWNSRKQVIQTSKLVCNTDASMKLPGDF